VTTAPFKERLRLAADVLREVEAELTAWSSDGDPYGAQYGRLFNFALRMLELESRRTRDST
jgi:hypothetical protein